MFRTLLSPVIAAFLLILTAALIAPRSFADDGADVQAAQVDGSPDLADAEAVVASAADADEPENSENGEVQARAVRKSVRSPVFKTRQDIYVFHDPSFKSQSIDKINRFEEVWNLGRVKGRDGRVWQKVKIRRVYGRKVRSEVGYVRMSDLRNADIVSRDDQPEARTLADCPTCRKHINEKLYQNTAGIRSLAAKLAGQSTGGRVGGFIWPVHGPITSPFGMRFHPVLHRTRLHAGIDIGVPVGTRVKAAKSGVVVSVRSNCRVGQWSCNGGNMVVIDHGDGTKTRYFHLSAGCGFPRVGQHVEQGQEIACSGMTGLATGPHLDFELYRNGVPVNPLLYLRRGDQ